MVLYDINFSVMLTAKKMWLILVLLVVILKLCESKSDHSTNYIWKKHARPSWAKPVIISYNESPKQIISVEGIAIPCSTKRRPSPPKPFNEYPTGKKLDLDKGHIMALSNGGPDISFNIVPQVKFFIENVF